MTVVEASPAPAVLLDFVDRQVRDLQDAGLEPRTILVGPEAYGALKDAVAARYNRHRADLEQYQWLTVVVDPFRGDRVCVIPAPRDVAAGVRTERLSPTTPT